jgi:transcription elongation factor Elf1
VVKSSKHSDDRRFDAVTVKKEILREELDIIKDTDIVFDCDHCDKSLAIDYRGAGLTIQCSDCGSDVAVPIPEGMELADIDNSDEEQEVQILNLRRSLTLSEDKVAHLEAEIEELGQRRELLEKSRTGNLFVFGKLAEQMDHIESAVAVITKAIRNTKEIIRNEKQ